MYETIIEIIYSESIIFNWYWEQLLDKPWTTNVIV